MSQLTFSMVEEMASTARELAGETSYAEEAFDQMRACERLAELMAAIMVKPDASSHTTATLLLRYECESLRRLAWAAEACTRCAAWKIRERMRDGHCGATMIAAIDELLRHVEDVATSSSSQTIDTHRENALLAVEIAQQAANLCKA
jgi:hypothetical protein